MKMLVCGAVATALMSCSAVAATQPHAPRLSPVSLFAPAWAIAPTDASCRTDIELTARSGDSVNVQLDSDGEHVALRFPRGDAPERAFLPIRVDGRPFANLVSSTDDPKSAAMLLSDETLTAMRQGHVLQIAWLSEQAVKASLAGSPQGLADLKACGAQVAAQARARHAQIQMTQVRKATEARDRAIADEQLATARAQTAAALAEQRRLNAEADRATAEADRQRTLAASDRQRAAAETSYQQPIANQDEADNYPYRRAARYPPVQRAPMRDPYWGYYRSPYDPRE